MDVDDYNTHMYQSMQPILHIMHLARQYVNKNKNHVFVHKSLGSEAMDVNPTVGLIENNCNEDC